MKRKNPLDRQKEKPWIKVLVVGQTPPPVHGQAVMMDMLLRGSFTRVRLYHVRLEYSRHIGEVGRFRLRKLSHLARVIVRIFRARFRNGARILYYPPAGPDRVPMYRDIATLMATRWLFDKVIFHFHAGGLSELYPRLSLPAKLLFRAGYFHPDCAIRLAQQTPPDGTCVRARREAIVPNGIEDVYPAHAAAQRPAGGGRLMFAGLLSEPKGVLVLLEACRRLSDAGLPFHLDLMGGFESPAFEAKARGFVASARLSQQVSFLGLLQGADKWRVYAGADIFCFPTHFEAEALSLVVLEAMMFGLPVVATQWRGIPAMVRDGETGYLVPIHDALRLAEKIALLLNDPYKGRAMGRKGRQRFLEQFTLDRWWRAMEDVFVTTAED